LFLFDKHGLPCATFLNIAIVFLVFFLYRYVRDTYAWTLHYGNFIIFTLAANLSSHWLRSIMYLEMGHTVISYE